MVINTNLQIRSLLSFHLFTSIFNIMTHVFAFAFLVVIHGASVPRPFARFGGLLLKHTETTQPLQVSGHSCKSAWDSPINRSLEMGVLSSTMLIIPSMGTSYGTELMLSILKDPCRLILSNGVGCNVCIALIIRWLLILQQGIMKVKTRHL